MTNGSKPIPQPKQVVTPIDTSPDVIGNAVPRPTKTPFYQAIHSVRYQRQAVIAKMLATVR